MDQSKVCDVCGRELEIYEGYWTCPVYIAGETKEADEHTSYPSNKSCINTGMIDTTVDTLGEGWSGQEETVLYNLNRLRREIYDQLPNDAGNDDMIQAFKLAWDLWGSDDTLLDELSDERITEMAERVV